MGWEVRVNDAIRKRTMPPATEKDSYLRSERTLEGERTLMEETLME